MNTPLANDLDHVLTHTQGLWDELRGQRIFITGGTGFFGCWLLESYCWANDKLGLNASAVVLTRDPAAFQRKAPHLAGHPAITLLAGDVRTFAFSEGRFSHVIHAATEASAKLNAGDPLLMFDTIVEGTRRTLQFARQSGAQKFLLTSSGAVYGKQPPEMTHIPEDYAGAPDPADPASAYGEGKRAAELLCALYAKQYGLRPKIARCFAFVGPYLPLDAHFAIGNFIRDAQAGGPIRVNGDGTPYRSYLYAADLAVWLWTILLRGKPCHPYNVGSDDAHTILDVAHNVADVAQMPASAIQVAQTPVPGASPSRYVPAVQRAKLELNLTVSVDLAEAVKRTRDFHKRQP
jgi:dTDP-glucose 4,6-dehydratase